MNFLLFSLCVSIVSAYVTVNQSCIINHFVPGLHEEKMKSTQWTVVAHYPFSEEENLAMTNKCTIFYANKYIEEEKIFEFFLDSYDLANNSIVLVRNRAIGWYDTKNKLSLKMKFFRDPDGSPQISCKQPEETYKKVFWKYDKLREWYAIYMSSSYLVLYDCCIDDIRNLKKSLLILADDINHRPGRFPPSLEAILDSYHINTDLLVWGDAHSIETQCCENIIKNCKNGIEQVDSRKCF